MKKEDYIKINSKITCKAIEFSLPVTGTIKYINSNTVIIYIEKVSSIDQFIAMKKNYTAVALIKDIA